MSAVDEMVHEELHSKRYSPSSFARRIDCPASAQMEEVLPDESSTFADEGSLAHGVASECLDFGDDADTYIGCAYKGHVVDEVMANFVQEYVDYVRDISAGKTLLVERRVDFSHLAPGGFGTADAIIIDAANRNITVCDLKYGKGVRVDAEENVQARLYAIGAYHSYSTVLSDLVDTITVVIHQPRLDHVSDWTVSLLELFAFEEIVKGVVERCEEDNPDFGPSESACKFCKARSTCKARADEMTSRYAGEPITFLNLDKAMPDEARNLSNDEIAELLPQLDAISDWISDIKSHAFKQLENGHDVPGYKLVAGRSNRRWTDPAAVESVLRGMKLKVSDIFKKELISVSQAEKKLGKDRFSTLADLVSKPKGKPTMAPISDKREAIILNFENLDG